MSRTFSLAFGLALLISVQAAPAQAQIFGGGFRGILGGRYSGNSGNGGNTGGNNFRPVTPSSQPSFAPQPSITAPPSSQPSYAPSGATGDPPSNFFPEQPKKSNSNAHWLLTGKRMSADQIRRNEAAIATRIDREFADLDREFKTCDAAAKEAIAAQVGGVDPAKASSLVEALKRGDTDTIKILTASLDAGFIDQLTRVSEGRRMLNEMRDLARTGGFTDDDRRQLIESLAAASPSAPPESFAKVSGLVGAILTDSQILNLLSTAIAGEPNEAVPLSAGSNGQFVIVPQLQPGAIIDLGNGAAFIGGGPTSSLVVASGSVSRAMGLDVAPGPAVPDGQAPANSGVILANAPDSPQKVNYTIDGKAYACEPGFTQPLEGKKSWLIAFDRGGTNGKATYTLAEGAYNFKLTPGGWELFKQTTKVTIDNTQNSVDFHYAIGGRPDVCPAGQTKEVAASYVLDLEFDDGSGRLRQKALNTGTYKVALAADERSVDLFEPAAAGIVEGGDVDITGGKEKPEDAATILFTP